MRGIVPVIVALVVFLAGALEEPRLVGRPVGFRARERRHLHRLDRTRSARAKHLPRVEVGPARTLLRPLRNGRRRSVRPVRVPAAWLRRCNPSSASSRGGAAAQTGQEHHPWRGQVPDHAGGGGAVSCDQLGGHACRGSTSRGRWQEGQRRGVRARTGAHRLHRDRRALQVVLHRRLQGILPRQHGGGPAAGARPAMRGRRQAAPLSVAIG